MQTGAAPIQRLRESLSQAYTIDRELGRGGMATVYLAQDIKHDRVVALKVLHPDLAVALGPDRFLREISSLPVSIIPISFRFLIQAIRMGCSTT